MSAERYGGPPALQNGGKVGGLAFCCLGPLFQMVAAQRGGRCLSVEGAVLHSGTLALYINPTNGSMMLQLLLGGVSGFLVAARMLKHKIRRIFRRGETEARSDMSAERP